MILSELEAKWPSPPGYSGLAGTTYFLAEEEQPWLLPKNHGIDTNNKVVKEAFMDYLEGGTESTMSYDPEDAWFDMTSKIAKVLTASVRKPKAGWSEENVKHALDKFMAILLVLARKDVWTQDARGKILFANPDCRKESVAILRKLDNCAVEILTAAAEIPDQTGDYFSLQCACSQLQQLMPKFQEQYRGFMEDGDDYSGHKAFSKALDFMVD